MTTMELPNPVEKAKDYTESVLDTETVQELDEQIIRLTTAFGSALGVEAENRGSVTAQVAVLESKKKDREILSRFPNARIFNPAEPLSWRDKDRMPVLAPFSLTSPSCGFTSKGMIEPFPRSVLVFYKDIPARLTRKFGKFCAKACWIIPPLVGYVTAMMMATSGIYQGWLGNAEATASFWLGCLISIAVAEILCDMTGYTSWPFIVQHFKATATFQGLIPSPARKIILEADVAREQGLFKEVFLLAEVPKWDIALEPRPAPTVQADPLIIAFDGEKHWLLESFNVTTVEMMAAGYTEEPPKA